MAREIDSKTNKPIVKVVSQKAFVNAVRHKTPVIEMTGKVAHDCFDKMNNKKALAKLGKVTLIGETIPCIHVLNTIGLISMGMEGAIGATSIAADSIAAAPLLFSPAGLAALGIFGFVGITAVADGKKFKKYEAEIVSEDDIIFRYKG